MERAFILSAAEMATLASSTLSSRTTHQQALDLVCVEALIQRGYMERIGRILLVDSELALLANTALAPQAACRLRVDHFATDQYETHTFALHDGLLAELWSESRDGQWRLGPINDAVALLRRFQALTQYAGCPLQAPALVPGGEDSAGECPLEAITGAIIRMASAEPGAASKVLRAGGLDHWLATDFVEDYCAAERAWSTVTLSEGCSTGIRMMFTPDNAAHAWLVTVADGSLTAQVVRSTRRACAEGLLASLDPILVACERLCVA